MLLAGLVSLKTQYAKGEEALDHNHEDKTAIVIIIDDIGNSLALGQQAINLPGAVNLAILPHSKNAIQLANAAHQQGKELLLHAPMSTIRGTDPGPGKLTADMDYQEFSQTFKQDLDAVPHIRGVNNHMGSLLTQMPTPMSWVMKILKQRGLYFVDSRTSAATVAQKTAESHNVPNLKRDIFLDNLRSETAIRHQFESLLKLADKQGLAVAIGHPYPQTLKVLEQSLPALTLRGYTLLTVSEALTPPSAQQPCQPDKGYQHLFSPACQLSSAHIRKTPTPPNQKPIP